MSHKIRLFIQLISLTLLSSLVSPGILNGETEPPAGEIAVVNSAGSPCDVMHIMSAYQVGSEVWVSTTAEKLSQACATVVVVHSQQVRLDAPALLVRNVGNFNLSQEEWDEWNDSRRNNERLLFRNYQIVSDYDASLGGGWAETDALGWAYVRNYPYIYLPETGWFYCQEGSILTNDELRVWRYGQPSFLAWDEFDVKTFYLWNEEFGWIMTSSYTRPYAYQFSTESWIRFSPEMVTDVE